jgi:hypothetical protein
MVMIAAMPLPRQLGQPTQRSGRVCSRTFSKPRKIPAPYQALILPSDLIGRALSQDETVDLLSMLKIGAPEEAVSDQIETAAA